MTFPLNEMYGYSRLFDRLRSFAIIWKQVSLQSSAIRDRLRWFAIIWKPAFSHLSIHDIIPQFLTVPCDGF